MGRSSDVEVSERFSQTATSLSTPAGRLVPMLKAFHYLCLSVSLITCTLHFILLYLPTIYPSLDEVLTFNALPLPSVLSLDNQNTAATCVTIQAHSLVHATSILNGYEFPGEPEKCKPRAYGRQYYWRLPLERTAMRLEHDTETPEITALCPSRGANSVLPPGRYRRTWRRTPGHHNGQ